MFVPSRCLEHEAHRIALPLGFQGAPFCHSCQQQPCGCSLPGHGTALNRKELEVDRGRLARLRDKRNIALWTHCCRISSHW